MDLSIYKINYFLSHIPPLEASGEKLDLEAWADSGIFFGRSNGKEHTDREDSYCQPQKPNHKVFPSRSVPKKMKLKFTKAWIAFLRLPLPLDVYKEVPVANGSGSYPFSVDVPRNTRFLFANRTGTPSKAVAKSIVYLLKPGGLAQKHLDNLVNLLEQYYHPSNGGLWTYSLERFLFHLVNLFQKRLHQEHFDPQSLLGIRDAAEAIEAAERKRKMN